MKGMGDRKEVTKSADCSRASLFGLADDALAVNVACASRPMRLGCQDRRINNSIIAVDCYLQQMNC